MNMKRSHLGLTGVGIILALGTAELLAAETLHRVRAYEPYFRMSLEQLMEVPLDFPGDHLPYDEKGNTVVTTECVAGVLTVEAKHPGADDEHRAPAPSISWDSVYYGSRQKSND